ncbi:TIR domain-containing protein [candidate division KSB1 bacterium]|nr:toll/interleukin-1 receptor domain-containing protein [candidate division KSB1 bacterium]RQW03304.1 MAG: TIR domain-containing protein [candidate division KSB1 bacterium]
MKFNFEKDIFISYAHLDNEALTKDQEGWIAQFHYALERRLAQLLSEKPDIWRDPRLRGNEYFGDEIIDQFPKVKILLSVLSPRYVKSEWCVREVRKFTEAAAQNIGVRIGNKSRIFKVIKTPVPLEEHPDEIRDLLGYPFYTEDDTGRFREFNPEKGTHYFQNYWDKFEDVAQDLCDLIMEVAKAGTSAVEQPEPAPEQTVYLAEASSDLLEQRDSIRRNLQEQGYTVFPEPVKALPFFLKDGNFRDEVTEYLKRCRLSIHLISSRYGLVPEDEQSSTIEIQYDEALAQSKKESLTCLIWMPSNMQIQDERQQKFIEKLRNDSGVQIVEKTQLEDLKTIIKDILEKLKKPTEEPPPEGGPLRVYLIYDKEDKNAIKPLDDYLYDDLELEVMKSSFDGTPEELRETHQKRLQFCDAAIIYYDHANELWLDAKMDDLRKASGLRTTNPMLAKAVYISGKKTEHKEDFRTREALVIKHFETFSGDVLTKFAAQLQSDERGGK